MTRPACPEPAWTVHPVGLLRSAGLPAAWLTGLTPRNRPRRTPC